MFLTSYFIDVGSCQKICSLFEKKIARWARHSTNGPYKLLGQPFLVDVVFFYGKD